MLIKDLAELENEAKITHEDVDYFSPDELKSLNSGEFLDELKRRKNVANEKVRNFRSAFKNQYKLALCRFGVNNTEAYNSQQIADDAMRMAAQELMNNNYSHMHSYMVNTGRSIVMTHGEEIDEVDITDGENGE